MIAKINSNIDISKLTSVRVYDFAQLYDSLPLDLVKKQLATVIGYAFEHQSKTSRPVLVVTPSCSWWSAPSPKLSDNARAVDEDFYVFDLFKHDLGSMCVSVCVCITTMRERDNHCHTIQNGLFK